jgi:translation initiation factor 5A
MERPTVSSIKKGQYVILENRPCRIDHVVHSKIGKHGHAKTNLTGTDCINGSKHMVTYAGDPRVYKINPIKRTLQLMSVNDEGKNLSIECFDEKNKVITIDLEENSRSIINNNKTLITDLNRTIDVNVLTAPAIIANTKDDVDCEFIEESIIESFAEQSLTI